MRSAPGFRRRRLSLTPLIDVIFLLLLFFMLSSTFTRFGELPLAAAAGGAMPGDAPLVFVRLAPDAISVNGEATALEHAAAAVRERLGEDGRAVLVSLQGEVTAQRLTDLLVVLRSVPSADVRVLG